eukprot:gene5353-9161_t
MKFVLVLLIFVTSIYALDQKFLMLNSDGHVLGTTPPSVKCERNSKGMCARGTVEISLWLKRAVKLQRDLSYEHPLNYVMMPSTHNSAITYADSYGELQPEYTGILKKLLPPQKNPLVIIANHWVSVTDQLNMGIRHIELDVHWFQNDARICHASNVQIDSINKIIKNIGSVIGMEIPWNTQKLGCAGLNRNFDDSLKEIKLWYDKPENKDEILVIFLDIDPDFKNWNKTEWLFEPIQRHFGNLVFSQKDKESKYPTRWPTPNELIKDGKRILFPSREHLGERTHEFTFYPRFWDEGGARRVKPFPICEEKNPFFVKRRLTEDAGSFGPFFNASGYNEPWHNHILKEYVDCNIHYASSDVLIPEKMEGFIWTWDKEEPKYSKGCVIQKTNSRWRNEQNCDLKLSVACQSNSNHTHWIPSEKVGSWKEGDNLCESGYKFGIPWNAYYNAIKKFG